MFTSNKKKSSKKNNIEDFNDIVNQIMSGKMDIPKSKKIDKNEDNDFCYDATSIDNAFNNALSERVNKDKKNKSKKMHNNVSDEYSGSSLEDDSDIVLGPIRYPTPLVTIESDENIDTDSDKIDNVVATDYDSSRTIRIVCEDGVTKTSILKMTDGIKTMSIDMAANTHMHADIPNVVSESEDIGEITRLLLKSILPCFYPMGIYSYTTIKKKFKNIIRYDQDQFYFYERNNFVTTYIVTPSSFESLKNVLDKARDADLLNELLIAILNMVESHGFSSRYISDNNNESMRFSMLIGTREQIHQNTAFENMFFSDIKTIPSIETTDLSINMIDTFFRSYQLYAIVYPTIIPWFAQYGMKDDVVTEILEINEMLIEDDTKRNIIDIRLLAKMDEDASVNIENDDSDDDENDEQENDEESSNITMIEEKVTTAEEIITDVGTSSIDELSKPAEFKESNNDTDKEVINEIIEHEDNINAITDNMVTVNGQPIDHYDDFENEDPDDAFSDLDDEDPDDAEKEYFGNNKPKFETFSNTKNDNDDDNFIVKRRN